MAGQGSLCQPTTRAPSAVSALCALVLAVLCPTAAHADYPVGSIDTRLHCEWNSPDVRYWNVRLSVIDPKTKTASISEIENHSAADATSGAIEQSSDKQTLYVRPRYAIRGGAVQLRVQASADAKLRIEVSANPRYDPTGERSSRVQEIALAELLDGRTIHAAESDGGDQSSAAKQPSWSVHRVAGDGLRVENIRDVPVYPPGSQFQLAVRANSLVAHASRPLSLEYSLYRISDGETVATRSVPMQVNTRGNSESISIADTLPELPGVYEVRCQLSKPDGNIWSRLRRSEAPIIRHARPIIIASRTEQPTATDDKPWRKAGVVRPSEPTWSVGQWLPKQTTRFIPTSSRPKVTQQPESPIATGNHQGESISLIPANGSFQATLPVNTPGLPHQVTIRYPADRRIDLQVDVGGADDESKSLSFVLAGDPAIGQDEGWNTHTFVYYPAGGDQIWLTNLSSTSAAMFESISVVAGPARLSNRSRPQGTARDLMIGLGNIDWIDSLTGDVAKSGLLATCDPRTAELYKLWLASNRLTDFVLASGLNGIMIPANTGARSWFDSQQFSARRTGLGQQGQQLATFMRLVNGNGIEVMVQLQTNMLLSDPERAVRERPALASQVIRSRSSGQYNPLSPLVRETLASLVSELFEQCKDQECFAGIALRCDSKSHLQPLIASAEDLGTLALYAQSKGATVGPANLLTWAQQQGQAVFDAWLREETGRTYQFVGQSCPNRPLLMVMPRPTVNDGGDSTGTSKLELFAQQQGSTVLVPAESFYTGSTGVLGNKSMFQQQLASVSTNTTDSAPTTGRPIAAILGDDVHGSAEPIVVDDQLIADISRIVDRLDPSTVVIGWPLFAGRLSDQLSSTMRSFSATPVEPIDRVDPTDPAVQTVHVTSRTSEGHLYVSMISLAPWDSEVELDTSAPVNWMLLGDDGGPGEPTTILESEGSHARMVVPAGQLITVKSAGVTGANLKFWSARVRGGSAAVEKIKQQVTLIVERIGILSDFETSDALKNGGFERSGGMGLVGWLHAQHPPGCVRIDDKESVEGNHSVLLTTDGVSANRTWLVSDTIKPPRSGRLAVSLAYRGELKDGNDAHVLRVSIEATRQGVPIRYTSEIKVPCNGQWGSREVVLEADRIEAARVDSLRLTIDSLSRGRIWIDDVRLHDRFPTAGERAEIQSQAFLAVQGLQRGNLTPSGRLLQNHWARHLLAQQPRETKPGPKTAEQQEEATPGVAERIFNWLPLRF